MDVQSAHSAVGKLLLKAPTRLVAHVATTAIKSVFTQSQNETLKMYSEDPKLGTPAQVALSLLYLMSHSDCCQGYLDSNVI